MPNYDFNWQRGYDFVEPLKIAAGTRLIHSTVYDNSVRNPGNPDPTQPVTWGLQSHQEMLYGDVVFSWVDETSERPIHDHALNEATQWVGFSDADMSGGVSPNEVSERQRQRMGQMFQRGDADGDGELSIREFYAVQQAMARQRGRGGGAGD